MHSNNENLRHMVAYTIMTVCDIVVENDQFKLTSGEQEDVKQEEYDELFMKITIEDPRIFFLKGYIPLVEDQSISHTCQSEDLFVVVANLLSQMDATKLKNLVNFETLFQKVASFVVNRHIIEQRFEENEDKML